MEVPYPTLWLMFMLLATSAQCFVYITPPVLEGQAVESPEVELYFTSDNWQEDDLVGRVVNLDEPDLGKYNCTKLSCVALTEIQTGQLIAELVAKAKERGFHAILLNPVLETQEVGYNNYIIETVSEEDKLPAFEVLDSVVTDLRVRMEVEPVTIRLTKGDRNPWRDSFESGGMIAWQVILATSSLGCVLLSLLRLYQFSHQHGFKINLATFGISMVLLSNLVSLGYFVADPLGSRRYLLYNGNSVWMTLPWSFALINTLSVCLFWSTIVKKSMKRNVSFLSARESVILGFGALLFFGQDITLSALRGYHIADLNILWLITGVTYTVLMLIIVGWFFQRGVAILKTLAGQKSMTGEGPEGEKKKHNPNAAEISTKLILMSSFGNIIFCCLLPILCTDLFYHPPIFVAIFFFIYSSLQWSSWLQLMTYVPRKK